MALATAGQRRLPIQEARRDVKYVVRAPDPNNRGRWNTVGVAFERKNGQPGLTIKLNTLPVGNWDGSLVCLEPIVPEGEGPTDE